MGSPTVSNGMLSASKANIRLVTLLVLASFIVYTFVSHGDSFTSHTLGRSNSQTSRESEYYADPDETAEVDVEESVGQAGFKAAIEQAAVEPVSLAKERQITDDFGHTVKRYSWTSSTGNEEELDLLWLTMTYDKTSWGNLPGHGRRDISHLHTLIASQYPTERVSLGILTSSPDEYERYKEGIEELGYGKVTIILHRGFHSGPVIDRAHRHDESAQTARRSEIAKLRNYLMLRTLGEEQHILWADADVFSFADGLVDRMVQHARESDEYGILTTRCNYGANKNYDLNAWAVSEAGRDLTGREDKRNSLLTEGKKFISDIIKDTSDDDIMPLDTVGAAILYMRASLVNQGLAFAHQYVVGTKWGKDGWDGIETEGLCYGGRGLQGGKCGVLGGKWSVEHSTD
ncbi:hypothetical protein ANO11243_027240 [Dothideomycetidae sp. 11243]|nr:hypothetical protein ANO11243_027240 [fungal sp. No.11243]